MMPRMLSLCFVAFLTSCSSQDIGIRPEEPPLMLSSSDPCLDYQWYMTYVLHLQAAYYARATGNRAAEYAGGTTTIGATSGAAGLAVGDVPSVGTMALFAIGQSFLGQLLGIFSNGQLASIYTIAANNLSLALDESFAVVVAERDSHTCMKAHLMLRRDVTGIRNTLEYARTDAASAALQKGLALSAQYKQVIKSFQGHDPVLHAEVVSQKSSSGPAAASSTIEDILDRLEKRIAHIEQQVAHK